MTRERYTVRKAIAETQAGLALIMFLDSLIVLILALTGYPFWVDLGVAVFFGPVACAAGVLGRVYKQNRRRVT